MKSRSVCTTKSKTEIIEAKEKLARAKLDEARSATVLAEAEMARITESSDDDETNVSEHVPDKSSRVKGWLEDQPAQVEPAPGIQPQTVDVQIRAEALMQVTHSSTYSPAKTT